MKSKINIGILKLFVNNPKNTKILNANSLIREKIKKNLI
jgi:hypothetical protein